jgi:hypothetical protein
MTVVGKPLRPLFVLVTGNHGWVLRFLLAGWATGEELLEEHVRETRSSTESRKRRFLSTTRPSTRETNKEPLGAPLNDNDMAASSLEPFPEGWWASP